MELKDIKERYQDNMGGNQCVFFVALADDIESWPQLPALPESADMDTLQVYTGNFQMRSGKRFYEMRGTEDSISIIDNDQGEMDGMSQQSVAQFFHPQVKAKLLGFVRRSNNLGLVLIIPDREGQHRVIGYENCPAFKVAQNTTTGAAAADRKGATLSFAANGHGPAPIYNGTIPLTEAGSGSGS